MSSKKLQQSNKGPSRSPLRVIVTPKGRALIANLKKEYGPLMFYQSGGCCDGSAPMCYQDGDFIIGSSDVLLGDIEGCSFYISQQQFKYWQHTQLIIDVVEGRGSGFSLEAPKGVRFLTRSHLWTQDEAALLKDSHVS